VAAAAGGGGRLWALQQGLEQLTAWGTNSNTAKRRDGCVMLMLSRTDVGNGSHCTASTPCRFVFLLGIASATLRSQNAPARNADRS
jgi:hypothetical protein